MESASRPRRAVASARSIAGLAAALVLVAEAGAAQDSDPAMSLEDVQSEFSEAFAAIADYSAQEREEALARLEDTLGRLDTRIEQTELRIREEWSEMSEAARERASDALRTMRERRNRLSEAYGALSQGAGGAWSDLMAGVRDGWADLDEAWDRAAETFESETENGE